MMINDKILGETKLWTGRYQLAKREKTKVLRLELRNDMETAQEKRTKMRWGTIMRNNNRE